MKRPGLIATAATLVSALVAVGAGVAAFRTQHAAADRQSAAAELFYRQTLPDTSGAPQPMARFRGKVVVVNFWATWCVPCVEEVPTFSRVHADSAGRVDFVGLGIDSTTNIAAFGARFKPSYTLVGAGAGGTELARAFGDDAGALPFTVVLDGAGKVVASRLGRVDEATLRGWIAPYLNEAGGRPRVAERDPSTPAPGG